MLVLNKRVDVSSWLDIVVYGSALFQLIGLFPPCLALAVEREFRAAVIFDS